jgi:lauroyl/myristoyl acyltransferase
VFRPFKNWLIFHVAKAAILFVGALPERWVQTVGRQLGAPAHVAAGFERNTAKTQLRQAFGERLSKKRCAQLTRGGRLTML